MLTGSFSILERFFDDPDSITADEMKEALRKATISQVMVPVMCGASFKNKGIQRLLDAVCSYLPSPMDVGAVHGIGIDDDEKPLSREPDENAPLSALAFKIATDPFVGTLTFFRVYSGVLKSGGSGYITFEGTSTSGNEFRKRDSASMASVLLLPLYTKTFHPYIPMESL